MEERMKEMSFVVEIAQAKQEIFVEFICPQMGKSHIVDVNTNMITILRCTFNLFSQLYYFAINNKRKNMKCVGRLLLLG